MELVQPQRMEQHEPTPELFQLPTLHLARCALALFVGGKMILNHYSPSNSALADGENSSPPVQANAILQLGKTRATSPSPAPVFPAPEQPGYYSRRIMICAGSESSASFRQYLTFDPASVLGVVAYGDSLRLIGRTIQSDGVVWYEAIAPVLHPSSDTKAQNRVEAGQTAWIAACFV